MLEMCIVFGFVLTQSRFCRIYKNFWCPSYLCICMCIVFGFVLTHSRFLLGSTRTLDVHHISKLYVLSLLLHFAKFLVKDI